jgi:acyl carrier protein
VKNDAVFSRVSQILTDYLRLSEGEVTRESHAVADLGADSLALVELGFKFMEAFGIGMVEPRDALLIVGNLVDHIAEQMASKRVS